MMRKRRIYTCMQERFYSYYHSASSPSPLAVCKHDRESRYSNTVELGRLVLKTQAVSPLPPLRSSSLYTPTPTYTHSDMDQRPALTLHPPPCPARLPRNSERYIAQAQEFFVPNVPVGQGFRAESRADHWSPSGLAPCRAITCGPRTTPRHAWSGEARAGRVRYI